MTSANRFKNRIGEVVGATKPPLLAFCGARAGEELSAELWAGAVGCALCPVLALDFLRPFSCIRQAHRSIRWAGSFGKSRQTVSDLNWWTREAGKASVVCSGASGVAQGPRATESGLNCPLHATRSSSVSLAGQVRETSHESRVASRDDRGYLGRGSERDTEPFAGHGATTKITYHVDAEHPRVVRREEPHGNGAERRKLGDERANAGAEGAASELLQGV